MPIWCRSWTSHRQLPGTPPARPITRAGNALVTCTDAWGRIANDVLTLSRPGVSEISESAGGGSSTMPHKQNPVLSVLLRGTCLTTPQLGATLHAASADQTDERAVGGWHAEWPTLQVLSRRVLAAAGQATDLVGGLRATGPACRLRTRLLPSTCMPSSAERRCSCPRPLTRKRPLVPGGGRLI